MGLQSTVWDEAVKIAGADQDFQRRDTFEAIETGNFPEWELAVQLFTEEEADKLPFDHLDATKLIPEEVIPLKVMGRMVLVRWPNNFFAETEQVAFCPSHAVDKGGRALLNTAGVAQDAGVVNADSTGTLIAAAKIRQWDREKTVRTLA